MKEWKVCRILILSLMSAGRAPDVELRNIVKKMKTREYRPL